MDEQKDLLGEDVTFNIDDVLIDRSTAGRFPNSSFFGLAVMCGSIGMASFMSASSPSQVTETGGKINSGSNMAGTKQMSEVDSVPMKNQSEDIVDNYVEQTPSQTMRFAFQLILQALMTMPAMAYISFALSFLFIVLWFVNPMSYLPAAEN